MPNWKQCFRRLVIEEQNEGLSYKQAFVSRSGQADLPSLASVFAFKLVSGSLPFDKWMGVWGPFPPLASADPVQLAYGAD